MPAGSAARRGGQKRRAQRGRRGVLLLRGSGSGFLRLAASPRRRLDGPAAAGAGWSALQSSAESEELLLERLPGTSVRLQPDDPRQPNIHLQQAAACDAARRRAGH